MPESTTDAISPKKSPKKVPKKSPKKKVKVEKEEQTSSKNDAMETEEQKEKTEEQNTPNKKPKKSPKKKVKVENASPKNDEMETEQKDETSDNKQNGEQSDKVKQVKKKKKKIPDNENDDQEEESEEESTSEKNDNEEKDKKGKTGIKRKREKVKRVECPDTVWVSQLTKENTEAELKKAFSKYGEIENIFLHKTKYFSYITFQNAEQAKKAIKNLNGTMIGNASIKVQARRPLIHSAELNVKNISAQTTFKSLVDLFSKAGDLQSVQLFQLDQNDAYAIVAFNTVDEASKAVELNGTTLDDRALTIQYQRRKKSEQERFTKLSKYRR